MSRRSRPHYRPGLGWILGVAFGDTLTRPVRLAQGFTCVRCCGSPRASSPHGLTAPALASPDGSHCVQLPPARGCYQLAPQRTFTSNPVPMPGTPPHAYVMRRRIEHAKRRLARRDIPLKVVAADCGFSDQSHMTRLFRRLLGTTPAEYRTTVTSCRGGPGPRQLPSNPEQRDGQSRSRPCLTLPVEVALVRTTEFARRACPQQATTNRRQKR